MTDTEELLRLAFAKAKSDSAREFKAEIIPRLEEISALCAEVASKLRCCNEGATEAHNVLWGKVKRLLHDVKQEDKNE